MALSVKFFLAGVLTLMSPFILGLFLKYVGMGGYAKPLFFVLVLVSTGLFVAGFVFGILEGLRVRKPR